MKKISNKGFTLVELIIVIAILGIIMLIALPNVPKLIQRQKVKSDIISAQKVGEYVRAWYSDYSNDELKAEKMTAIPLYGESEANSVTPKAYDALTGIDDFIDKEYVPTSLLDANGVSVEKQKFAVFFKQDSESELAKIVVAIVEANPDPAKITWNTLKETSVKVGYDGTSATADTQNKNIAYIEK